MNHPFHRPDLEQEDTLTANAAIKTHLQKLFTEEPLILDIGANRGQFAEEIIEIVPSATIYSLEPVPQAFNDLEALSKKHTQIRPFQLAIGKTTGKASFNVTESDVGSSFLNPLSGQPSKWLTPSHQVTVDCMTLKDFIEREDIKTISLLKSDAQGFDLEVLQSASQYLNPDYVKAILVELNFRRFYESQANPGDLICFITKKGYRAAWFYPHRAHDEWLWWADALFIADN